MAPAPYPCQQVVPIEHEPHHHLVIANDFVRAFAVEIPPHERTLCHHHPHDYLMYVAGDAEIVNAPRDGELAARSYRDGDSECSLAGLVHVVENLMNVGFRNLLIELLPGLGELQRQGSTAGALGEAEIRLRFEDKHASIFVLQLQDGSQVEIGGPAIVASPYSSQVELVTPESKRALNNFIDLAWIAPNTRATLCNYANRAARAVLIALGRK